MKTLTLIFTLLSVQLSFANLIDFNMNLKTQSKTKTKELNSIVRAKSGEMFSISNGEYKIQLKADKKKNSKIDVRVLKGNKEVTSTQLNANIDETVYYGLEDPTGEYIELELTPKTVR